MLELRSYYDHRQHLIEQTSRYTLNMQKTLRLMDNEPNSSHRQQADQLEYRQKKLTLIKKKILSLNLDQNGINLLFEDYTSTS
ncbi:MAG: hypothetical protein K0R59_155 [Sphingobacterium sp.]|jgi:hypothetical protein|nr:hypothetical protein [Sphingobacterium sp.]